MSKHSKRHQKARMIRAASAPTESFRFEAAGIEWIKAAEGDGSADKPKRFSMTAYTGGAMHVGFDAPVVIELSGLTAEAPFPALLDHQTDQIIGHAESVEKTAQTIKLSGVISGASPEAQQVIASAALGFPWKASVGASREKMEFIGEDVSVRVNGRTFKGPIYVLRKGTLGEVSFVALAADSKTSVKIAAIAARSQHERNSDMKFDEWIKALFGGETPELTDAQTASLKARFDAEVKASEAKAKEAAAAAGEKTVEIAAGAAAPTFDLSAVVLAYEKHVAAVQAKVAGYVGKIAAAPLADIQAKAGIAAIELKANALDGQWPAPRLEVALLSAGFTAEVALLNAERPKAPTIHGSTRDVSPQIIEAALCRTLGLQTREKLFKPEVLEAADTQYRGGLGLQQVLLMHAAANGFSCRPGERINDGNLRDVLRAGFSTHSLTTLLTTLGNKALLDGFNVVPQTWREVATTGSLNDFKTHTRFRLSSDLEYEEVGPAGEIKHGTVGQESYTMAVKTFGKMLAITRQDIINDDLGAFQKVRQLLGLGAALKMNNLFWTVWLAASNAGVFWAGARGNLVTSSALAEAGLTTAVKAFRDATGPDGNMLGLQPAKLLVPTALEFAAKKLFVSQEVRDTTSSTKTMTSNIYQNAFRPVVVPELGNSGFTGYSATTWWMLCEPAILASAVMAFLNGQESPTIESADADFDTLGIQLRGYHDFYPVMTEYRASVKATA